MIGIVYKSTGSWYTIKTENNHFLECRIKGKFRMQGIKSTNPIAVGDVVDYELENTTDVTTGVIVNIHERKNYIVRKSVNLSHQMHIIASNIDVVFLLVTINNPPTTTSFIDRFLVTAEAYGIEGVLVFNKIDTFDEATLEEQLFLQHIYSEIGYKCLRVSAKESKGIEELKALITDLAEASKESTGWFKGWTVESLDLLRKVNQQAMTGTLAITGAWLASRAMRNYMEDQNEEAMDQAVDSFFSWMGDFFG